MLSKMLQDETVTLIDGLVLLEDLSYNGDIAGIREVEPVLYQLQKDVQFLENCYIRVLTN